MNSSTRGRVALQSIKNAHVPKTPRITSGKGNVENGSTSLKHSRASTLTERIPRKQKVQRVRQKVALSIEKSDNVEIDDDAALELEKDFFALIEQTISLRNKQKRTAPAATDGEVAATDGEVAAIAHQGEVEKDSSTLSTSNNQILGSKDTAKDREGGAIAHQGEPEEDPTLSTLSTSNNQNTLSSKDTATEGKDGAMAHQGEPEEDNSFISTSNNQNTLSPKDTATDGKGGAGEPEEEDSTLSTSNNKEIFGTKQTAINGEGGLIAHQGEPEDNPTLSTSNNQKILSSEESKIDQTLKKLRRSTEECLLKKQRVESCAEDKNTISSKGAALSQIQGGANRRLDNYTDCGSLVLDNNEPTDDDDIIPAFLTCNKCNQVFLDAMKAWKHEDECTNTKTAYDKQSLFEYLNCQPQDMIFLRG